MTKPEPAAGPAAELWRKTLQRIPTHFGRLVFLASLRDLSGRYAHPPLSQIVGHEITDRTLRHSHHEIFSQWLSFSLSRQKADLDEYQHASGVRGAPPQTMRRAPRVFSPGVRTVYS